MKLAPFLILTSISIYLVKTEITVTFALQWPLAARRSPAYNNFTRNSWTVHGLWPNCCRYYSKPSLRKNDIQDILPQLHLRWPDIKQNRDPYYFWNHEWEKHGCRYIPALSLPRSYFIQGLRLHQQHNFFTLLYNKGIYPRTTPYSKNQILKAFRDTYHLNVTIFCTWYNRLTEIRICLNANFKGIDITKCGIKDNCPNQVYYVNY